MRFEDISRQTLTALRRALAGSAIAAVAVFGVAACEDPEGADAPTVDTPGDNQGDEDDGGQENNQDGGEDDDGGNEDNGGEGDMENNDND
ncbi:hypothetical protein [Nocardiopsis deserti]|uniref:hypothetical protein n=1 Tax=Nocardiopsis deserti TaxID=2605988 RepID=UPI00123A317D|nr:hypothetical protein [Nocardiopsis deserti]